MKKSEILKNIQESQIKQCNDFLFFIKEEGFIETIDKCGNFAINMPLYYKKVSEDFYLAFNIPTFSNIKKYGFHADFWKVNVSNEYDLLNKKLSSENVIDLRLSFNINKDLDFYKSIVHEFETK